MTVEVQKLKGDGLVDFYVCRECGRRWKSSDKKIGHSERACKIYHKKRWGWA